MNKYYTEPAFAWTCCDSLNRRPAAGRWGRNRATQRPAVGVVIRGLSWLPFCSADHRWGRPQALDCRRLPTYTV